MSEMSGDGKDSEVTPGSNSEEPKKKPDLTDTLNRLLRTQEDVDKEAGKKDDTSS